MISSDINFRLINESSLTELYGQEIPLSQVAINLINNAVDAISTLPKPRFIEFRIYDKEDRIYFSITDSGTGIPLEVRNKMLTPFFTTKNATQGTGLGLSISLEIIRTHSGELYYVEESINTRFEFYLPKNKRNV
jgi:C4-dicarboxylate-specific signal transduction histidine kinase